MKILTELEKITLERDELLKALKQLVEGLENDVGLSRKQWELTIYARASINAVEENND